MNFGQFSNNSAPASTGAPILNLSKGGVLDLTKAAPALKNAILAGGWDVATNGPTADLDISAYLVGANGKIASADVQTSVVCYIEGMQKQRGIMLEGDNRTGAGEGDDERIDISLDEISPNVSKIVLAITIYDAEAKGQTFGMVKNAYVRLLDADDNERELLRYNLSDNYTTDTAVVAAELNRNERGWEFKALGNGLRGDINTILQSYM